VLSVIDDQRSPCFAQDTAFTYQGRLNDGANPANGIYDLRFAIYDSLTGGSQIGSPLTNSATGVSNGLFTVTLDFGAGVFTGPDRWLEIAVRTNGNSAFSFLAPRQTLTPAPYAITAGTANSVVGLIVQQNTNGAPNVIGGSPVNFVAPGVIGSVIAGGGATNYSGSAASNSVYSDFGTIAGGKLNTIQANSHDSTIGGGFLNTIETNSRYSTIGGGEFNTIQANAHHSTIGGGGGNTIQSNADYSMISGGRNTIQSGASGATVGGGVQNTIQTNAIYSTIGGGTYNTVLGQFATIPGGLDNTAAGYDSFAAGTHAHADHPGSFVWSDSAGFPFVSTTNDQFSVRSTGGARFVTANAGLKLGSGGDLFAPGGVENLRLIRGVVHSAGTILHGTGFTVVRTGTGAYTITLDISFPDFPAVFVSAQAGVARIATTTNIGNGSFQVRTFDATGAAVDAQFHFIASGPQ
jgi:hypothetical protein